MKKGKIKIALLLFIFIFLISSNIDISNKISNHYNNNVKEDDDYTNRIRLTQSPINSSVNWWNSLYNYRTPINITNIYTKELPKGYSVNISVNTAKLISDGKIRSDGNDLRIAWYNFSNKAWLELDRVNESNFGTIDTRIWFKTQEIIDPGTSDTNYYLYYGNPNAFIPPMNKSKIYDFFDDFTQPDGPANGWTVINGTWSVNNNEYVENLNVNDGRSLISTYLIENASIEVFINSSGGNFGAGVMFRHQDNQNFYTAGIGFWEYEVAIGKWTNDFPSTIDNTLNDESVLIDSQWYHLKIEVLGAQYLVYLNGILKNNITDTDHLNPGQIGLMTWTTSAVSTFDNLKIRLLLSQEPNLKLGNEEIYRHSSEDFLYYKTFTIDNNKVLGSTNLNDFPLLISIEDPDLRHHCQPDGDDIAFSNGTIWLDHEIELFDQEFNESHAKFVAWVRIPSLSPIINTNITMYYGNPAMNSQENPIRVWNNDYKGVWHLKEDPSTSKIKDSTSNSYHGTSHGSMTNQNQLEGKIGGSIKFDGLNDYINLGSDLELKLNNSFTFEAWYSGIYNDTVDTRSPIYCNGFSFSDNIGIRVQAFHSNSGRDARIAVGDGSVYDYIHSDSGIDDNTWTHLVGTYDGITLKLYINGTKQIDELVTTIAYNYNNATIGINLDYTVQCYKGLIDELRLIAKAHSAEWIATEYNNQYDPNSFYSYGKESLVHKFLQNENYFAHYKIITINHTQVSGDGVLLDFPLLLSIIDSDLHEAVQADGDDIAFAKDNVWLAHEKEVFNFTYSPTESQLICWVRIPFLSSTNDTQFRMYYGNLTINSQENPLGVWDDNYKGVWHLSEDPTGTVYDSTRNNNDGASYGSMSSGDQVSGKIDGSINFDGNDDNIGTEENNLLAGCSSLTMSAWIKPLSIQSDFCGIIEYDNTSDGSSFDAGIELRSTRAPRANVWTTSGFKYVDSSKNLVTTDFTYFVFVYDGDLNIYLNGSYDISTPHSGNIRNNRRYINIGRNTHDGLSFNGIIDEIHISNINRSADWIATEYNNQDDPNSFYSIGIEHHKFIYPPNSNFFKYYKEIIIDHTKVDGSQNLIDFPVLINILDSDLHDQNKVQEDGDDIAFSLNNLWLNHEIEYFNQTYNDTQAKLVAWVRIPSLSPYTDTIIRMYYGNSTMNTRENPSEVWDINYVGVWHLSEDPSEAIYDSTSNNNDGTSVGNIDQMDGIIDGSLNFYGANDYINCGNDYSLDISENITIEHWIKGNDFSNDPDTLTKGTYEESYSVWILADGRVTLELNNQTFRSTSYLSTGVWNYIACTYDGNTRKIFINGTEDNSGSYSTPIEIVTGDLTISSNPWSFDGIMDEIRISNITRSPYWLETQFNNQYNPNSFYSIGTENNVVEDTIAPEITINSPNLNDFFGWNAPSYDLTVIDGNLDSIWYSLNEGFTNSTSSTAESGTIDQTLWEAEENGTLTIRFYANDTFGNIDYEDVLVNKDIFNPSIDNIDSPLSGEWFNGDPPDYSLSITEANLDEIWYTLDEGTTNYTGGSSGTIDSTAWSNADQGPVTIIFYVNDSAGNWNSSSVVINRDTINPSIDNINSPLPGTWFNNIPPDYNLSITEANIDEIWYSLNGGTTNYTGGSIGTINSTAWSNADQGPVTIIFYVNDSAGNWNFSSVIINRDTISPTIVITEPNNYDLFGNTPPDINVDINDINLDKSWYQLENGTIITENYTWTGLIAQNVWDQVGNGTVTIRFYANDTGGNLETKAVIVHKDIYFPVITIINPNLNDVYNNTAPIFTVSISGSNLNSTWYTLDDGLVNYTFTGLAGRINQVAWIARPDGIVTFKFYINNTLGVLGFDEVDVIKDVIAPQITLNLPLNNTFCGIEPIINVLVTDANIDTIWYEVNANYVLLANDINQQFDSSIWTSLLEGEFNIYIYANDSAENLSDPLVLRLYKDTYAPSAPILLSCPQGEVSGNLMFEWEEGSDPSGISKYRLIIDNEANPFTTPGFVFESNITGTSYTFTGTLPSGTYYFFLYQIDGAGHQSSATTGNFSISSTTPTSQPPEFPIWIIFIIIGAVAGGVVGIIVLKKSKSKKEVIVQIPEKKPKLKEVQEVAEELSLLDYDMLKVMNHDELIRREEKLLEYTRYLEENKKYGKVAEFIGELILIEEIMGNLEEAKLFHQKQIDVAVKGLEYLKEQYEIESKDAAISGDYSKALELYNESKLISDNLKGYMENQNSSDTEESVGLGTTEPKLITLEEEIVYSCVNDLLTKYFDDIDIKYYSNPQIYYNNETQINGLILADQFKIEDIDPLVRERIKSIQIIYTENLSNENIARLCQAFHNQYALLFMVGITWPKDIEAQIIEIPQNLGVEYQENIRIVHHDLFATFIGLKGAYKTAFDEIIELYNRSEIDILRETHESSEIIIHSTDELRYDLKEKGLITDKLEDYFNR